MLLKLLISTSLCLLTCEQWICKVCKVKYLCTWSFFGTMTCFLAEKFQVLIAVDEHHEIAKPMTEWLGSSLEARTSKKMGNVRNFVKSHKLRGTKGLQLWVQVSDICAAVIGALGDDFSKAMLFPGARVLLQASWALLSVGKERCSDCPASSSHCLHQLASTAWCFDCQMW